MKTIHRLIDQTLLKPETDQATIVKFLQEVRDYKFYAVCVNPCWVEWVRKHLPIDIKVCSVVGFPLGASTSKVKAYAAEDLVDKGCDEIDMVMNIGALKSKNYDFVRNDIAEVVNAAKPYAVKVILETCLLTDEEKVKAALIAKEAGAKFVKTSTGFSTGGATVSDIKLLRRTVGEAMGVKAAGGIRDYKTAKAMIDAGANRIGTSAGVKIIEELKRRA
jgi:deoxyribose-phosphate aldolase